MYDPLIHIQLKLLKNNREQVQHLLNNVIALSKTLNLTENTVKEIHTAASTRIADCNQTIKILDDRLKKISIGPPFHDRIATSPETTGTAKKNTNSVAKGIYHLQKINEKYANTKRVHEDDLKKGFKGLRAHFDPVYYDEQGHKEVLTAIEILTQHHHQ